MTRSRVGGDVVVPLAGVHFREAGDDEHDNVSFAIAASAVGLQSYPGFIAQDTEVSLT
jgi:hypothetical protein